MGTTVEYIEYVCGQIRGSGDISYKKMFGEYMVYVNLKPVLLVCNGTVYVKKLPELSPLLSGAAVGAPYNGAKDHYILDIDNEELAKSVVGTLEPITPIPKPRAKKKPKVN